MTILKWVIRSLSMMLFLALSVWAFWVSKGIIMTLDHDSRTILFGAFLVAAFGYLQVRFVFDVTRISTLLDRRRRKANWLEEFTRS